jgi:hypothetical protein
MCGCGLVIRTPAVSARAPHAAGGGVTVHPGTAAVEQDRAAGTGGYGPVEGPCHGWWQRDQDDLGAFAADAQYPVPMFFAEVGDNAVDPATAALSRYPAAACHDRVLPAPARQPSHWAVPIAQTSQPRQQRPAGSRSARK